MIVELALFSVEVHRAFEPPLDGLAAAQERAVDPHLLAVGAANVQDAAIAQRQAVAGDESQPLGANVADVEGPRLRVLAVAVELQRGGHVVSPPAGVPPALAAKLPGLEGGEN